MSLMRYTNSHLSLNTGIRQVIPGSGIPDFFSGASKRPCVGGLETLSDLSVFTGVNGLLRWAIALDRL